MKIFEHGEPAFNPEDLRRLLREGDPASELPPDDALALRSVVLREAANRASKPSPTRSRPIFVTACALAAGCLALAVGIRRTAFDRPVETATTAQQAAADQRPTWVSHQPVSPDQELSPRPSQIQFSTPGGTRIIWLLVPEEPQARRPQ